MKVFIWISAAVLLACNVQAHAGSIANFIDHGAYSSDAATGLDWLDLTATQGESFITVLSGSFITKGWRYARLEEVSELYGRYIAPPSPYYNPVGFESATQLIRQMGVTTSWTNNGGTLVIPASGAYGADSIMSGGFFDDGTTNSADYVGIGQSVAYLNSSGFNGDLQGWLARADESPAGSGSPFYGSFLVRETFIAAVPEPGTYTLMLAGLGLMGVVARRRNRRAVIA